MRRTPLVAILLLVVAVLGVGCATMSRMETIESLLAQAKELLDAKRYDEALAKLTEVIRRDPLQWKAYLYSAQAYIGKVDWSSAIASARKALDLAPADTSVLATLGESLWGGAQIALGLTRPQPDVVDEEPGSVLEGATLQGRPPATPQ